MGSKTFGCCNATPCSTWSLAICNVKLYFLFDGYVVLREKDNPRGVAWPGIQEVKCLGPWVLLFGVFIAETFSWSGHWGWAEGKGFSFHTWPEEDRMAPASCQLKKWGLNDNFPHLVWPLLLPWVLRPAVWLCSPVKVPQHQKKSPVVI